MSGRTAHRSSSAIVDEFAEADLGDPRLKKRLLDVVTAMAAAPDASFAAMVGTEAEREGLCRFVRNPRVDTDALLEPHVQQTAERAAQCGQVLVVHDTTEVRLCDEADLESYVAPKRKGFRAHLSLVLDATQERCPLGVVAFETIERKRIGKTRSKAGRPLSGNQTAKLKNREYERWGRGIENAHDALQDVESVIHVLDAEGDSYELLAALVTSKKSFVVRLTQQNRRASDVRNPDEVTRIQALLDSATSFKRPREIHVSKRKAMSAPSGAKARPTRDSREAKLTLSHTTVDIHRPRYRKDLPEQLRINVVRAHEANAPEGEVPIEWILATNIPVETKQDVEQVIDIYRQRWLIEEFFKVLKTGCSFRKRRLTNQDSIYNTLTLLLPIAWQALALRHAARTNDAPASRVLSPLELDVLQAKARQMRIQLPSEPTAEQALTVVAQIGGYRKSNGPPGWEVLMRGLQRFQDLAAGWALHEK